MMGLRFIRTDIVIAVLLVTIVTLLVIPIPTIVIDLLLSINLTFSVILLMTAVYIKSPIQFITFPSVILIGTAFRIAMSVATTRLILAQVDGGSIIETFGNFVVSGSILIGLVIFMIISVVQFIVVTKGAERVAEVAARFALDSMPGKQLSIDADIRSGALTQEEGIAQRAMLDKQSQYLGAMDGAMKFVKGDAIAGIVIMCVNLIGGFAIGTTVHGMSASQALESYSILTIGDGLVAQIPSLLMAVSAGIIITRVTNSASSDLGTEIATELTTDTRIIMMASPFVILAGFVPGFPTFIFVGLGAVMFAFAFFTQKRIREKAQQDQQELERQAELKNNPNAINTVATNRFILYLHGSLRKETTIADAKEQRNLMCAMLRDKIGLEIPNFGILGGNKNETGISILFDDVELARDKNIPDDCYLSTSKQDLLDLYNLQNITETSSKWPGGKGFWIPKQSVDALPETEIALISQPVAIVEAVSELYEKNISSIITRNEVADYFESLESDYPASIKKITQSLNTSQLVEMFRIFIKEGVPFKPHVLFMNSMEEILDKSDSIDEIVELLRKSLCRQIVNRIALDGKILPAIIFDHATEQKLLELSIDAIAGIGLMQSDSAFFANFFESLNELRRDPNTPKSPAIIINPILRRTFSILIQMQNLPFPVLALDEIPPEFTVQPLLVIGEEKNYLGELDNQELTAA